MTADPKTIAVDIDDTLNNFTEVLRELPVPDDDPHGLSPEVLRDYVEKIRAGVPDSGALLSTDYSFLRFRLHHLVYERAGARPEAVAFMQWLRAEGWRIVICTQRDLRRSFGGTKAWLAANGIPFDHLFSAANKIVFCRAWGIAQLIDDDPFTIAHGAGYGVQVYFPVLPKHRGVLATGARGFTAFEQLKPWIQS